MLIGESFCERRRYTGVKNPLVAKEEFKLLSNRAKLSGDLSVENTFDAEVGSYTSNIRKGKIE